MSRSRKTSEYWFDADAADRACAFFEELQHIKGPLARQPFKLEEWQREDIVRPLFGYKRADGTRKYRIAYVEIGRKNGKSTLAAGIALYLTFCDGEEGAEVYSVASDRDQALMVYDPAVEMVRKCPMLAKRARIYESSKRIVYEETSSFYRAIAADAAGSHGYNCHAVLFDEFHTQRDRELHDTLQTSMGGRSQPVMFITTTSGYDRSSICWEMHQRAMKALNDPDSDPTFLPVIYAADPDEDWTDERVWERANPNIGISIRRDYLREQCEEAKRNPAFENTFRRLHLNQWTEQNVRWMPMDKWDLCIGTVDPAELEGRECFAALDLATARDLSSLVLLFPFIEEEQTRYKVLARFWAPSEASSDRAKQNRQGYAGWAQRGDINLTPGATTDYEEIRRELNLLSDRFTIKRMAFDPWNAKELYESLLRDGWEHEVLIAFAQNFANFNEPTKRLMELVLSQQIEHGGNPVLRWMAGNVTVREDPSGNLRPDKAKSAEKIDGMVALIMALGLAISETGTETESAYDWEPEERVIFL